MAKNNYHRIRCWVLAVIACTQFLSIQAQKPYTGAHSDLFIRRATDFLRVFYGMVADMTQEDEVFDMYLRNVQDVYVLPGGVFSPDFISYDNRAGQYSFQSYVLKLKESYPDTGTAGLSFRLDNIEPVEVQYTEDGHGVLVNLRLGLSVLSGGQTRHTGGTQAIVAFPDMMNLTGCKVRQIIPLPAEQVASEPQPDKPDNYLNSVPGAACLRHNETSLNCSAFSQQGNNTYLCRYNCNAAAKTHQWDPADATTFRGPCFFSYADSLDTSHNFLGIGVFAPYRLKAGETPRNFSDRTIQRVDSLLIHYDNDDCVYNLTSGERDTYILRRADGTEFTFHTFAAPTAFLDCQATFDWAPYGKLTGRMKDFKPVPHSEYVLHESDTAGYHFILHETDQLPLNDIPCLVEHFSPSTGTLSLYRVGYNFQRRKIRAVTEFYDQSRDMVLELPETDSGSVPEIHFYYAKGYEADGYYGSEKFFLPRFDGAIRKIVVAGMLPVHAVSVYYQKEGETYRMNAIAK